MDDTSEHPHEPTVDDLRVKLCYICREEELHDSPPHPPTVWLHPCKCTLIAHKSCLLHWIKTQQREFGRSRGDVKCPQCGELYEFEGFNPRILRIFNSVNRTLSRSGRIVTACCIGTVIFSSGAGIYLACASYGAFAVREFIGPDIFRTLLTSNPTNWPAHAWLYLPMIPFSLIVSRTPRVIWTTSPLVTLILPWTSTVPVSAAARGSSGVQFGPFASRPTLWPPPPALVCALFPVVRVLYRRLRNRIIRMMVQDILPTPAQAARQQQQQRIQEQRQREDRLERLDRLEIELVARRRRADEQLQRQLERIGPGNARRFHFNIFGFEVAHLIFDRPIGAGEPAGPGAGARIAPAVAAGDGAANGGNEGAVDNAADGQQQPRRDGAVQVPELDPPAVAPADQDDPQQQQEQEQQQQQQQQPPPEPQEPQRAEPEGQGQEPVPPAAAQDDEQDPGAAAANAIRMTGTGLGRLVGGALLVPSIARIMGSVLLHISHAVPLIRTIIAPFPAPLPPPRQSLFRLIRGAAAQVGYRGDGAHGWLSGSSLGALVLRGLLATSQEWATSDPVWWRNTLGLGIFLVVKDGLKLLHLWLAKREIEERHIKNKSFAGIDLTGLELVERHRPEA